MGRLLRWFLRPRSIAALLFELRLSLRLLREPAVPLWAKTLFPLSALYLVSPLDALPDVLVGPGMLDDVLVLAGALKLFVWLCPQAAVAFHRQALSARRPFSTMPPGEVVIDAEFRREG